MGMNKRKTGNSGELAAVGYLRKRGIRIIEHNFRIRQGEIDLVGYDHGVLVFFEVKYRKSAACGLPQDAVGIRKQEKICKVAAYYRSFHNIRDNVSVRYDVIAILGDRITWIKNAFPERYAGAGGSY